MEELRALIAVLIKRIAGLERALAKARKEASTSSQSSSSYLAKPKPKKAPGRRKTLRRGGQPLPPEKGKTAIASGFFSPPSPFN